MTRPVWTDERHIKPRRVPLAVRRKLCELAWTAGALVAGVGIGAGRTLWTSVGVIVCLSSVAAWR